MTTPAADYQRPSVTVDIVLFSRLAGEWRVLLIQRGRWPFAGHWALPGGFVEMAESLEAAAARELLEETGLSDVALQQIGAFGEPGRDPRSRVITVAYAGLVDAGKINATQAGDDAADARWWAVAQLPPLAFDHDDILRLAAQRMLTAPSGL